MTGTHIDVAEDLTEQRKRDVTIHHSATLLGSLRRLRRLTERPDAQGLQAVETLDSA